MPYTQENRLMAIDTPLGTDVLLLTGFSGSEGLSMPFSFSLNMISETHDIKFEDIVGKSVTVSMVLADGEKRFFNGIISSFSHDHGGGESGTDARFSSYSATMVPWLWLLTKTTDLRIFQEKSVEEIIEQIFTEKEFLDFRFSLTGTHDKKNYCVQYRETDFDFISRLLEDEGIYYFFEHEEGKHTLVMADSPDDHKACPHQESASYELSTGGLSEVDSISSISVSKGIRAGKFTHKDFNFETPNTDLKIEVPGQQTLGPGEREIYDYPGEFGKRDEGERFANIRMQEREAAITSVYCSGNCRAFTSGYKFKLENYFRDDMNDKEYVLKSLNHSVRQGYETTDDAASEFDYNNSFTCIPFDIAFRPPRVTPKPIVEGVQTAFVVGPDGEEIHTDEYGRVKVQFHWDREGEYNENSSCYIRVASGFAGGRFGTIFLPRVGHEVVVDFIEGDPDRPIIVGSVYNANNMPPYTLPDEKTKSTIKTLSSPDGGGFNEIRFEDKKGEEQLFVHAEYDQDNRVKNDSKEWVGHDRHLIVIRDQKELVSENKHLKVLGDHNEMVDGTISVESAMDIQEKAGMNHAVDAGQEIHLKGGMNVVIEAGTSVTLKAGGGFIVVGPAGVTISGNPVLINSGGSAGSGSGCSPAAPEEPLEADEDVPGEVSQPPDLSAPPSPQAQTLQNAAESGAPFCET